MTRARRVVVEGGYFHVYNRLGRGERVFDEPEVAEEFVGLLKKHGIDHDPEQVFD